MNRNNKQTAARNRRDHQSPGIQNIMSGLIVPGQNSADLTPGYTASGIQPVTVQHPVRPRSAAGAISPAQRISPAMLWSAAAGAGAGFIGAALAEPIGAAQVAGLFSLVTNDFMYFGIVSLLIGAVLGALPGIANRSRIQLLWGAIVGGLAAGIIGGLGAIPAEIAYHALGFGIVARAVGWGIAGASIGLSPGLATRDGRRTARGFIAGAVGGVIAGVLFDLVGTLPMLSDSSGTTSRFVADVMVGLAVGLIVALVESVAKVGWLNVISGKRAGAEFILSKPINQIGRDDRDDILLWGDPLLALHHAKVTRDQRRGFLLEPVSSEATTFVNGTPLTGQHVLRDGDQVTVGSTQLVFRSRESADLPESEMAPSPPPGQHRDRLQLFAAAHPELSKADQEAPMQLQQEAAQPIGSPASAPQETAAPQVPPELPVNRVPPSSSGPIARLAQQANSSTHPRAAMTTSAPYKLVLLGNTDQIMGSYELPQRPHLTIGRDLMNDLVISDGTVSAHHAVLLWKAKQWIIKDQDSSNGTFVTFAGSGAAERRVQENALRDGSLIRLGRVVLRLEKNEV